MFASQQGHRLSQLLVAGAVCAALASRDRRLHPRLRLAGHRLFAGDGGADVGGQVTVVLRSECGLRVMGEVALALEELAGHRRATHELYEILREGDFFREVAAGLERVEERPWRGGRGGRLFPRGRQRQAGSGAGGRAARRRPAHCALKEGMRGPLPSWPKSPRPSRPWPRRRSPAVTVGESSSGAPTGPVPQATARKCLLGGPALSCLSLRGRLRNRRCLGARHGGHVRQRPPHDSGVYPLSHTADGECRYWALGLP